MKKIPLTQGQFALVDDDDYDELSAFKWCAIKMRGGAYYAARSVIPKRLVLMHRQILGLTDPKIQGDHRNHDTLDNRRENIRAATHSQNQQNRPGLDSHNTSGFRGVSWNKKRKKWVANIGVGGKYKYLGLFTDINKAAAVYSAANRKYFGEFGFAP